MDVVYRLGQFWRMLTADPLPAGAWREIESILTPAQATLFRQFATKDRQHSYRVMRTLREAGHTDPDLLAAALLHDVGKARHYIHLRERVLIVLAEVFLPGRVEAWGQGQPEGWQRPFVIRAQHPAWGAEMAAEAGSSPTTVALIRHHQDKPPATGTPAGALLPLLQWADDQN